MNTSKAIGMAYDLMREHNLFSQGWSFKLSRGKSTLGTCYHHRKLITISRYHIELNDEAAVRDTILHEIAHAIAGRGNGHNHVWKAICRRIGANPSRCDTKSKVPPRMLGVKCPVCKRILAKRHRKSKRVSQCSCKYCGPSTAGKLLWVWLGSAA